MNINSIAYDIVNMAIDWCNDNDLSEDAAYIKTNRRELFKKFKPICEEFIAEMIYNPDMLIDTSNNYGRTPVLERFFQGDIYTHEDVENFQAEHFLQEAN